ncbi:MAG: DUF3592 domain-containing protein [Zoogloeaceae bacterium]|jgi:hypothetical protein|nr:DUF3592 domain-containing protein [Zoogloeaceae bacterium]
MSLLAVDTVTPVGRAIARAGLVLLAIILLCGGTFAAWQLAVAPLCDAWRSRNWPQVSAKIDTVHLVTGAQGSRLEVRYRYRVNGEVHRSERYGLYTWLTHAESLRQAYAELLYAKTARAWVNPSDPDEALLNRDIRWSIACMAIPAVFTALLGAALLWAAMLGARDFGKRFLHRRCHA